MCVHRPSQTPKTVHPPFSAMYSTASLFRGAPSATRCLCGISILGISSPSTLVPYLVYLALLRCLVSCMNELSSNLSTVFLVRLAYGNVSEVVVPILKVSTRGRRVTSGPARVGYSSTIVKKNVYLNKNGTFSFSSLLCALATINNPLRCVF